MGLRERKKLATRRTLQRAAIRLTIDHGLENVTVDDIAASSEVSARTFFNYFSSKEDALIGDGPPRPHDEAWQTFVNGGPTGDLIDDLKTLLFSPFEDEEDAAPVIEEMRQRKQLIDLEPQLISRVKAAFAAGEQQLSEAVATRLGEAPEELRPRLVAEVGLSAMRFSMRRLSCSGGEDISEVRAIFDQTFAVLKDTFRPAQ